MEPSAAMTHANRFSNSAILLSSSLIDDRECVDSKLGRTRLQVRLTPRSIDTPSRSAQNRNANVGTFAGRGGRQAARAHWHRIASSAVAADNGIRARPPAACVAELPGAHYAFSES